MEAKKRKRLEELLGELEAEVNQRDEPATVEDAVKAQHSTREMLERIKQTKTALENRHQWLSQTVTPARLEERDVTALTIKDIGRVTVQPDVYVSIKRENHEDAYQELRDLGFEDMITETVNGSTLAAFVRNRLKSGEEIPEGITYTPYQRAVIQRVN